MDQQQHHPARRRRRKERFDRDQEGGRAGGTVVFASAVWRPGDSSGGGEDDDDFVPLTVDYRHKSAASGVVPWNARRRDPARPSEAEILAARFVDRALRPRLAGRYEHFNVSTTVHSSDGVHDPVALATNAASAAVLLSGAPCVGPVGCARVGMDEEGRPSAEVGVGAGDFDLLYATGDEATGAIALELGCAPRFDDAAIGEALAVAHASAAEIAVEILKVREEGEEKNLLRFQEEEEAAAAAAEAVEASHGAAFRAFFSGSEILSKIDRGKAQAALNRAALETAREHSVDEERACKRAVEACAKRAFVFAAVREGRRVDGRHPDNIRPLAASADLLPAAHGSAQFSRGETEVMATATLDAPPRFRARAWDHATTAAWRDHQAWRRTAAHRRPARAATVVSDEDPPSALSRAFAPRRINNDDKERPRVEVDDDDARYDRRLVVHYDFPAAATGAAAQASERRAVGHGALAERAVSAVFPSFANFPYSARVAADVLASAGSSSMATVCAASLALFDAGVPLAAPVAGISIGAARGRLLVDLNGTEDHYGDMDFKIAGTASFVTAAQLDVKPPTGVTLELLGEALAASRDARSRVLDEMAACLPTPRPSPKPHAPRVETVTFDADRLVDLLGPRGRTLREIESTYRCVLDTTYDGQVLIFALDAADAADAKRHVTDLVAEVNVGDRLRGVVVEKREYGAVLKLLRNREGLLHISEFKGSPARPEQFDVGQDLDVVCVGLDPVLGNIKLSRKALDGDAVVLSTTIGDNTRARRRRRREGVARGRYA
ncbi:hypothetical protein CTAYLR_000380 [Chrysophaeum taylorii]|uniref:polyribonucleotide nucleotidyltransferase n=1 Tax=Chrysophaeum taylorii TaxID=2483200 RepID=A0AAD7UG26_9STRA|nr:hypothetical protein CTAYLR_000380 [Chrysophaeum taylorii]